MEYIKINLGLSGPKYSTYVCGEALLGPGGGGGGGWAFKATLYRQYVSSSGQWRTYLAFNEFSNFTIYNIMHNSCKLYIFSRFL